MFGLGNKYLGVRVDYKRDEVLSDMCQRLVSEFYCNEDEKSPQQAFARAAVAYSFGDMELAQRIYDAVSKGWFMYSSPVLSNAPMPNEKPKALPISCFLTYVPDTLEGLIDHTSELRWLSVKGGGVGGHWSDVRAVSKKAPGPMPFLHTVDADMTAYRQGKTRKGSYAAYIDMDHPDIVEFINMRIPTGDVNRKNLNLHHAVNVTDKFMEAWHNDEDWDLIDPASGEVRETVRARALGELLLETRYRTGEPYVNFIDTVRAAMPQTQKDLGLEIHGSNLCNEIHLATNDKRTAVCCLSSLNLERYDEWKDTNLVGDLIRFLDNVLQFFIDNAGDEIQRARYSAERERSLGLGAMGFHAYLQKHRVAFESAEAETMNKAMFKDIQDKAIAESLVMGEERGVPTDMLGTGRRNAHLLAIAPNANSSMIGGTSPSIEPWKANAFTSRSRVGSQLVRNPYLEEELEKVGKNTDEVWSSIITNGGSVQHLDFLSDHIKDVFKTAIELDQNVVVKLAGDRQKYLCQGQSLNVFFPAKASKAYLYRVHRNAWLSGCKGMYYLRTETSNKAENVSAKVEREKLQDFTQNTEEQQDECVACQG